MNHAAEAPLTPEEQAQMLAIQDRLIALLVDCDAAVAAGRHQRAASLRGEIDDLFRRRDDIKLWAAAAK